MNIAMDWLAQYVDLASCDLSELCEKLTMAGIEVEGIHASGSVPEGVVIGEIRERAPHPGSDHLSVCKVFDGKEVLQIVCGAPNCDAGKKVPLATIGTVFKDGDGEFKIKKSKLRGVESFGMMCSAAEIGVGSDDDGLLELSTDLPAGTPLQKLYPGEVMLELETTPNRPDWLSHWGIARDVSCLLKTKATLPEIPSAHADNPEVTPGLVTVEAPDLCPLYTGRIIRGVKIAESPQWLQKRLQSVGLRPINNVVDVTNFVLMELGQPLHAFDLAQLSGNKVVVRRAAEGEKIRTLDGKELTLSNRHLVIADGEKPAALAGVMGGENSGVTENTTDILLESAIFNPDNIRLTSRELGISSDSSYRFERGVDFDMARVASDRAVQLILATAGGTVTTDLVSVSTGAPPMAEIDCNFDRVRQLLGFEVPNGEMLDIFRRLGLNILSENATTCRVQAPRFRPDLEREADLIEEVARVIGLDAVPVRPVSATITSSARNDALYEEQKLRHQLIALGLYECMNYSMVSLNSALSDPRFTESQLIKLGNPVSLELTWLRPSLWGEMLSTVERNIARRNLTFKLFEIGRVFCGDTNLFPEERLECCIMLSGRRHPERYSAELDERYDFYDLKGLLESFCELRHYADVKFEPVEDPRFAPHCAAKLLLAGQEAGRFGKLAGEYVKSWRTTDAVFAAVLDVNVLLSAQLESDLYVSLSQYPATTRDVAFIAPGDLTCEEITSFIRRSGLKNLEKVELFDLFEDEKVLGAGRKSVAYKLTFRHPERTLTDDEVNASYEKIRKKLEMGLKVELR